MSSSPSTPSGYDLHWMDAALEAEDQARQDASRASAASNSTSTTSSLSPPNTYSDESLPDAYHTFMPFSRSAGSYDLLQYPVANALETFAEEATTNPPSTMAGAEYTDTPAASPANYSDDLNFKTLLEYVAAMSSASTPECIVAPYAAFPEADEGLLCNQLQAPSLPAQYPYHPSSGHEDFYPPSALPHGMAPENCDVPQAVHEYGYQVNMQEIEAICDSVKAEYLAATRVATLCTEPLSATRRPNEPVLPAPGASTSTSAKSVGAIGKKGKGRARDMQENVGYIQDATTSAFLPRKESDEFAQYDDQALYSAFQGGRQGDGESEWAPGIQYKFRNMYAGEEPSKKRKRIDETDASLMADEPKRIKRVYTEIRPGVYSCSLCDEELNAKSKKKHGGQCGRTVSVCNICGYTTQNRRNDSLAVHQKTAKCRAAASLSDRAAVPGSIDAWTGASFMAPNATDAIDGDHGYDTSDGEVQARGEGNDENS
ncbi:hypothetical protein PLEOSDRAFT_1109195 [Pleurotus ostreatus PC15]|uniref:Uncharacterized protein n=1 Tax=Pleurotus ostreatus (strain PC15) TaxID=1137138 RepID=A0A067N513_PLEO1|nr:hypothetical protein PLEOSDRAFT_1109195 [Pleurotus ostreatus PC15]